jgi:branched-chain amino acid transport system substrate-binding protein
VASPKRWGKIKKGAGKMKKQLVSGLLIIAVLLSACGGGATPTSQPTVEAPKVTTPDGAPAQVKIGFSVFLSGGAAAPFGIPAKNGAEVIIAAINSGQAPAPYNKPGIAGVPISAVYIDESGGAEKQITELRRLSNEEKVNLVIGYTSSTSCLAAAPVAEELKTLTVVFDCGTSRLFEERDYKYVFRTNAHQAIDSLAGARYALKVKPDVQTIAGINQNYSWGQDSWAHFRDTLAVLKPEVKVVNEQFPKLNAGDYSAEISALAQAQPNLIHSSFWGADLDGLMIQAAPRGIFDKSTMLLSVGEYALPGLGDKIPKGTIIGGHGPHGVMAPSSELNDWLVKLYTDKYGTRPTYPVYHMAQSILGAKLAYEKAIEKQGKWPTIEQVIEAFEYMEYPVPGGTIKMAIGKGHQAIEPAAFAVAGSYDSATKEVKLENLVTYPAECVNPPDGMTTEEWIKEGFPGAKCP